MVKLFKKLFSCTPFMILTAFFISFLIFRSWIVAIIYIIPLAVLTISKFLNDAHFYRTSSERIFYSCVVSTLFFYSFLIAGISYENYNLLYHGLVVYPLGFFFLKRFQKSKKKGKLIISYICCIIYSLLFFSALL